MTYVPEILIVDDTQTNIDILGALLSGYRRRVATDGAMALEMIERDGAPDLVLLDVVMPGLDGFEVCRRLRDEPKTREVPVIFITALDEVGQETTGFDVGGVDYITKPFSPSVVRARVRTHLELKAARDALRDENARLEERVEERTAELRAAVGRLRRSSIDTVTRLALAAEYRDDATGRHVARMAHYSVAVARQLGWSDEALECLLHAAPMHDIGKIATPDEILRKPGPLAPDEWTVMQQHPLVGARILSGSDSEIIQLAEVVALTHHEKWDGSGYPQGLEGESIPLVGRIVAICDVFDALTIDRPYKSAYSPDEAFAILRQGEGRHFDPAVVAAFFASQEQILEIRSDQAC
jgi:putative two-component system response regulator